MNVDKLINKTMDSDIFCGPIGAFLSGPTVYMVGMCRNITMVHADWDNVSILEIFVGWAMCAVWPAIQECDFFRDFFQKIR